MSDPNQSAALCWPCVLASSPLIQLVLNNTSPLPPKSRSRFECSHFLCREMSLVTLKDDAGSPFPSPIQAYFILRRTVMPPGKNNRFPVIYASRFFSNDSKENNFVVKIHVAILVVFRFRSLRDLNPDILKRN